MVDDLRERMGELMRREDVTIEVRGWTKADLEAMAHERRQSLEIAMPLLGTPPGVVTDSAPVKRGRSRSHDEIDVDDASRKCSRGSRSSWAKRRKNSPNG